MQQKSAIGTMEALIAARNSNDLETAFSFYHKDATIVLQPGQTGSGVDVIKGFIAQPSALSLRFENHQIIEAGETALHTSKYTLDLGDSGIINGRTADVLQKQPDGTWRIIIDNAWAGSE